MSTDNKIDRKEAIKRAGLLLGGVVFAPNILGVLNGCTATPGDWTPTLFSNDQARLVTALADVILPADDSPAASEVGVPQFIETMVDEVYSEVQQREFLEGLDKFADDYRADIQAEFFDGDDTEKYDFTYHQNLLAVEEDPARNPFILTFKELTLLGYFTSEAGATEVLRYEKVPGAYEGCIPYEDVGKTWATS
ncbi:gluconate 2-dehydrogenase subunit 3 family protein [Rhodohalobacter sp. 8-1]|uniref:gluconate 2-dehydrogenase subunit 3 family protein n=1 Tax=Rhodohalobacter sp. 8-1 TaxID=3131972 RepID=UPI0030EE3D79